MKVEAREYKLLVEHEPFTDPAKAVEAVWAEIAGTITTLPGVRTKGKLDELETRGNFFLDTPDLTLRRNGLVLRQRGAQDAVEHTLKCRSEDRYFSAGTPVDAAEGLETKTKLEEDVAPPFRCRFSHSATLTAGAKDPAGKTPKTLGEAAALFPVLGTLRIDRLPCPPETALVVVNEIKVDESVWTGGKIVFEQIDAGKAPKAEVALILWTRGKAHRPAVAELSFRIKDGEERYSRELAAAARAVYELLQRLDCARPAGMTKTEYVYRDGSRD